MRRNCRLFQQNRPKGDIHFAAKRAAASRTLVMQEGWFQGNI
jgi:hypothetical protein